MRDFIHNTLEDYINKGHYTKAQDFNKHPNGPFVYSSVTAQAITQTPTPAVATTPQLGGLKQDKRGRLFIAKKYTKQANMSPGDRVQLFLDDDHGGRLAIQKFANLNGDRIADYVVDTYGNVKIAKKHINALKKITNKSPETIKIEQFTDAILIF